MFRGVDGPWERKDLIIFGGNLNLLSGGRNVNDFSFQKIICGHCGLESRGRTRRVNSDFKVQISLFRN